MTPLILTADVLTNQLLALVASSVRSHQAMQGLAYATDAILNEDDDYANESVIDQVEQMFDELTILGEARRSSLALMQALKALHADTCIHVQAVEDVVELEQLGDDLVLKAMPGMKGEQERDLRALAAARLPDYFLVAAEQILAGLK